MAKTEVDIINEALLLVGQKETIASRDEGSTSALIADLLYDDTRDEALAAAPWPFARRRATLALLSETRTGWQNVYALPTDCISTRYISDGTRPGASTYGVAGAPGTFPARFGDCSPIGSSRDGIPYSIESSSDESKQVLLTDQDKAELIYTARMTVASSYPILFCRALKASLASKFAGALPVKAGLADYWEKKYKAALLEAIAEAFRSEKEDPQPDARHIAVRG